jgi:hypothetical protein
MADARMKPIGAYDQVGIARPRMIEGDPHALVMFVDGGHGIVGHAAEDADVESSSLTTVTTDEAHFAYLVAEASSASSQGPARRRRFR